MARNRFEVLVVAALCLPACADPVSPGSLRPECGVLQQANTSVGTLPTFSYAVGPVPAGADAAIAGANQDGGRFMFQAGIVLLQYPTSVDAAAVGPLARDFGLEVVELIPIGGTTLVRARIRDLAAVDLSTLQADGLATNLRGAIVFEGHDAAAVYAVAARINRQGGCYAPLSQAGVNNIMTPL